MVLKHLGDTQGQDQRGDQQLGTSLIGQASGDGFTSYQVVGLAPDQPSTPTGMRDEILLVSWLIILLRTREDGKVSYDWAYKGRATGVEEHEPVNTLSTDQVMPILQSNIQQVAEGVSQSVQNAVPGHHAALSSPTSLLLSTGSLSMTPEGAREEGVIHLEVHYKSDRLEIRPVWHSQSVLPYTVTRHVETLVDAVRICLSNPGASIEDSLGPTTYDMDSIWSWNHLLPPTYDFCMHEMIAERAQTSPDKVAIHSWDGDLTYGQIEQYSTYLACSLRDLGVQLHDFLPICYEKSKWTVVAVLAVMKAGATIVLMDPSLPLARLQNMAVQVGAKIMLTSPMQHDLSASILPEGQLVDVGAGTFASLLDLQVLAPLPAVPATALMYIIFTSGSTGTPKGVKIAHRDYTSSAMPRAKAVGYNEDSRVLDFASYAFDVSIDSMLLTLGNGGCLCIPSDEDRLGDINGVIRKMQVNYAGLTPSVARILEPDVITSLSALGLGGEAASPRDVNLWGQETRIVIGYGPCECTIGCTVNGSAATGRDYISIGPGNGAAIWITNPNDHNSLMPVGAVGELLVEGPIVGRGYLNDPDKTAAAFIEDPPWLLAGHRGYAGRRGRLYKTGDLGRYDPDGSGEIVFVGRKDTQVKLRGQRVELGEIESQLKARLPSELNVIAEVIVPQGPGGQPTLVAFVAPQAAKGNQQTDLESAQLPSELRTTLSTADTDVAKVLPRYMVPTAYVTVNHIPTLISGKTDRKRLRAFGATVDLRQLDRERGTSSTVTRELTDIEQSLRQAWALTLKLDADAMGPDDNFFALGGDSLAAMRLVSVCRERGLELTVISTFSHPTLSGMAQGVLICDVEARKDTPTFSMLSQSVEDACLEASQICGVDSTAIEDMYPCTPTQESLFTFSLKSTKAYVAQRVASIPSHITLDAWKKAWEVVVAASPILRSRLVQLQDPGLQQVVLKEGIHWKHSADLKQYLQDDQNEKMHCGQSLARYAIVENPEESKRYMVWTIHHVVYDGWSEPIVLEQVRNALKDGDRSTEGETGSQTQTQMRDFVKFVRDTDEVAMQDFWRQELEGAVGPQFPRLPSRDFMPTPDALIEHQIALEMSAGLPFTPATLIRGAWALVASQYTGSDDVLFGETLTGRDIALPGVEGILGPLVATVPIRVHVNRASSVASYLQTVQQVLLARTPYQHMGWQNIRKVSRDAQYASEAGTGLVIQPDSGHVGNELGFEQGDPVREALHFNPYPLMVACGLRKGGFRVCASFDSSLIEAVQMKRILEQLEKACLELTRGFPETLLAQISCLPEAELDQIWRWNKAAPLSLDRTSRRLRADASIEKGSAYPQVVVPWVCDPRNSSLLSPIGCAGELWLEGAFLQGQTVGSPAWLLAGSPAYVGRTGRLQSTGDMVQLQDDGSLIFLGRKDNVVPVQGHAVDISELEAHFARTLPSPIRAAAAVLQLPSENSEQVQELVAFIEHQSSEEASVEILPAKHDISRNVEGVKGFETSICATIPISLSVALKKLDKSIENSLPSYMVPTAYIVVERMPTEAKQVDHNWLNQLASAIPQYVLDQLREGLREAWKKNSAEASLAAPESILRSSWAKVLGISPEKIDIDDNFFRLGGDSVLAMKLVSSLRAQGHGLTVADIFQHMRLGDVAKVLKVDQVSSAKKTQPYKPFSMLGSLNATLFLDEVVRPKLAEPTWKIQDVLPVTDSQALDITGTIQVPRTSIQYTMLYFDEGIDQERLLRACNGLVKTHDILRTVFIEHGSTFFQVVLENLETPLTKQVADKDLEQFVTELCTSQIEYAFDMGSSFLKMFHVEGQDGQHCLILGLSHAQYDGMSLPRLLHDLETLYEGEKIADFEPFSSYMSRINDENGQVKARTYWSGLLNGSSLSALEGTSKEPGDKAVFQTSPVDILQPLEDITTANLLTAAWALVLARCIGKTDVTFGSVTSGRGIDLTNVENVMGPCYQLTPVRVPFKPQWTAMDLLHFVQRQSAESAAHDSLGFERISQQCTQWSSSSAEARFFDSIVHHQDFEDFDTMPFAGRTPRVDILKPHGDAAYPLKAVSFIQGGKLHVGVVGSERDADFVDSILAKLVIAVQDLAGPYSEQALLDDQMF
ncbi:Nonribosomal peptide synthetase 4 [Cytospora mali]|uniref:Nonribosomal peptide synthetase 4 n=1 Tax=Cytospora mali TaxID=578113 RepID=A0A194VJF2_CYTMA|nr:Nonribosomal peptide synthetase 4 [Valsa mali]